jgi:hypothetical protein
MAYTKICNLTPKDYKDPSDYLRDIDKDMTRLATYLGNGVTEDIATAKVGGGTRTLHVRNGIIQGYTDS